MASTYECATCGIVTKEKGHLCNPIKVEGMQDYCGQSSSLRTAMMCAEETQRLKYECSSCGRTAETVDLVCSPRKV